MSVGKNIPHDSSLGHVSGGSIFIDDRGILPNEVHVGIFGSPIACGTLTKLNIEKALDHPDCIAIYTYKDFVAQKWGAITHDQVYLVSDKISYMAEPICLVVSSDMHALEKIKALIQVDVQREEGIYSIEEAKKKEDILYKAAKPFEQGDVEKAFKEAKHTLSGTFFCGGQEHFYMESQAAVVYPMENGQMEVHASSQHPSETQRVVAEALGLPFHQVVCIVKRMGGGFGGKESQAAPIAAYAAIAAKMLNRPARCILNKDDDMKITGKRHPFLNEYQVAFDDEGVITGLKALIQSDGGAYNDLSSSILERAMFHTDGAYYLKNVKIEGVCYRTNNHSNTAYRGFGGPQGNMTIESIIEDIAHFLKKDSYEIRRKNIYIDEKVMTPYGQKLENNMLPQLFDNLYVSSDYKKKLNEVIDFNNNNLGKVRGLSMSATKFGIAFTARFLNQGNALVNLHLDGTVQASTGGTEMGQGLNTKIAQIVANAFGIKTTSVQMMTTSTEKNHNTSPTAASSGTDINGAAALMASNKIKSRLTSLAKEIFAGKVSDDLIEFDIGKGELDPDIQFKDEKVIQHSTKKEIPLKELINTAYFNRIGLGAYGHYKTPQIGFSKNLVNGKAFNYYSQGTALSVVEIDEYTGELKVLSTDILMDLGRSINPGIDRGQVTGAFVQAQGWVTTENLYYDKDRNLISHSPTTYKIPNIQDTPRVFNIDFIENNDNECNVHRSKAVGEPPFVLGISVWTAAKHALSFRAKKNDIVNITSPCTAEVLLLELERLKNG